MSDQLTIIPLKHIGEINAKTQLADVLFAALKKQKLQLIDNDVLVITQKIVSKAEGRIVDLDKIKPSAFSQKIAKDYHKNAAHIELILQESKRIVRMDHGVIITETHQGFICANAGIDESNIGDKKNVSLLPSDPDASAKKIQHELVNVFKIKKLGVIISDSWGRPWREGQVNFAIGTYGIDPLIDYRGEKDVYGYILSASVIAIADELASAAELMMGKTNQIPAVLIRGYHYENTNKNAKILLRNAQKDMFR
jgi:coenzyme F420-0:L-glutamate ligase / coenzyme F420-1:gamma-L-glutamate ligase